MKKLKRMLAVLLTAIMTLAMATTAFAATPLKGNLTVNLQNGSLKGQRIYLFKLFDYKNTNPANYTANTNYRENLKKILSVTTNEDYDLYSAIVALGGDHSTNVQNFANNFTKAVITNGTITGKENTDYWAADVTTETKSHKFENVNPGYYLVYLGGSQTIQSSLVTVDSDVTVELKSTTPTPDKEAYDSAGNNVVGDVQIGNVLTYKVKTKVPDISAFDQTKYKFSLKDTLSAGLDFVADANGSIVNSGEMPVKVTVNAVEVVNSPKAKVNGRTMTLDLSDVVKKNQTDNIGAEIVVTYYAKVNKNAVINNTQNEAKLEYSNDPSSEETTESVPDIVKTPTFPINVHKYEKGKDTEYLAGAKFQLHKETEDGTVIKMEAENSNGKYVVAEDQASKTAIDTMTTVATNIDNGGYNLQINGLAAGTYYLVETGTPGGFNKVAAPIRIVISNTTQAGTVDYSITVGNAETPENDKIVKVENVRGTILPGTGGMGTVLFTVIGIGLVLIIAASFVISRRKRAE